MIKYGIPALLAGLIMFAASLADSINYEKRVSTGTRLKAVVKSGTETIKGRKMDAKVQIVYQEGKAKFDTTIEVPTALFSQLSIGSLIEIAVAKDNANSLVVVHPSVQAEKRFHMMLSAVFAVIGIFLIWLGRRRKAELVTGESE